jgi:hypothetical protein
MEFISVQVNNTQAQEPTSVPRVKEFPTELTRKQIEDFCKEAENRLCHPPRTTTRFL